jgi:hypothetical protein
MDLYSSIKSKLLILLLLKVSQCFWGFPPSIYDIASLVKHVDLVFIMAYDERNDFTPGRCIAWANAPHNKTQRGSLIID